MEGLGEPHLSRVLESLRARARDVDAFVSTSQEYADRIGPWLGIPAGRLSFAGLGLNMEGHGPDPSATDPRHFTIGYMARIAPEKGLHQLVEALGLLAQRPGSASVRVRAAGYLGARDKGYFAGVQERVAALNVADRFEYVGEVDRPGKIRFLQSIDAFSVPTVYRESKGRSVLEAMANAVPVVQPRHGSFPEMIGATGGGLLCEPGDPRSLADALESLRTDPPRRLALGAAGREGVRVRYSDTAMAERTLAVYRAVLAAPDAGRRSGHA
jgi:glycosyltransferase involved in cell wall biosynthesis